MEGGLAKDRKDAIGQVPTATTLNPQDPHYKLGPLTKRVLEDNFGKGNPPPPRGPAPPDYTELKVKANDMYRTELAKKHVVADYHEQKWNLKVREFRVKKRADKVLAKRARDKKEQTKRLAYMSKLKIDAYGASQQSAEDAARASLQGEHMSVFQEREHKASTALQVTIKKSEAMAAGEGDMAKADRRAAEAAIGKLRVAKAHVDHELIGLTDKQRHVQSVALLHQSLEDAVANPNVFSELNVKRQMKESQWDFEKTRKKEIKAKNKNAAEKTDEENTEKEQYITEQGQKRWIKKMHDMLDQDTEDRILDRERKVQEDAILKKKVEKDDEVRHKWLAHEQKGTQEVMVKADRATHLMRTSEITAKSKKNIFMKTLKDRCKTAESKHQKVMEGRNKVIVKKVAANRKVKKIEGEIATHAANGGGEELLLEIDESAKTLGRRLLGRGSRRRAPSPLSLFRRRRTAPPVRADPRTAEAIGKTSALNRANAAMISNEAAKKREITQKMSGAERKAKKAESVRQRARQAAHREEQSKLKATLRDAKRKSVEAQRDVKEANEKAADADTQQRRCMKHLERRRRTCACDDFANVNKKPRRRELGEVGPMPTPPPPVPAPSHWTPPRIPGKVCPCCPAVAPYRSWTCQLYDARERTTKLRAGNERKHKVALARKKNLPPSEMSKWRGEGITAKTGNMELNMAGGGPMELLDV